MINGHGNEYIVLFGNDRYEPGAYYRTCRHRFTSIKEARMYANRFLNAYIFKLHWRTDSDEPDIRWVI